MRTGLTSRLMRMLFMRRPSRRLRRTRFRPAAPLPRLEPRVVPSGAAIAPAPAPALVVLSAITRDSRGVTVDYRIDAPGQGQGQDVYQFHVYRSRDALLDGADRLVGGARITADLRDDGGRCATAPGRHELTFGLPAGLPPDPGRPYVLVAADPGASSSAAPGQAAAFRKYTIGVVTHGALINSGWKHGSPWQLQTAKLLQRQGYDQVIPFNWVSQSDKPGRAAAQGARLARQVLQAARRFPAGAPVDLHFIGHSEGTVVNTQAIVALQRSMIPELEAGAVQDTLLDPHAANNSAPGQASTSSGLLGALAGAMIADYQSRAGDPPVFIPRDVDSAQVFYQRTPASRRGDIYNLWGQVPVPNLSGNPVAYYNLSAAGVTHSGNHGVALWYRNFVAPTLKDQAPLLQQLRLSGTIEGAAAEASALVRSSAAVRFRAAAWGAVRAVAVRNPTISGHSAPGATVRIYASPAARPLELGLAGTATADAEGNWSVTARPLRQGQYRAVALAYSRALRTRPGLAVVAMQPLGRFTVGRAAGS